MTFADRITRLPIAYNSDRGADAAAKLSVQSKFSELVAGAAGCSPYLASLVAREADWLNTIADRDPKRVLSEILEGIETLALADLKPGFRQAKRKVALLAGLADLGGVWDLEDITTALTDLSDRCLQHGTRALVEREISKEKLPGQTAADAETGAGMCILAMGKTGAGELNYSSDIDLICLFDESRFDVEDYSTARASFVKITRDLMKIMSDVTADGYVFRTDLRLRPDAAVTPVCIAMETAERYYESVGRTWERAAFIKARPCAGDIEAGVKFLERLEPFIWRRHLDFAAIQDAHDMRLQIRSHKQLSTKVILADHDMKLGVGGIREIEFFTQTRQLIAGGRDTRLRVRGTVEGLSRLADAGWIISDLAEQLTHAYRAHREVEHRLQMIGDAQTHKLPSSGEGFDRLARFMGIASTDTFKSDLGDRLNHVAALTGAFFEGGSGSGDALVADNYLDRWCSLPALRSPRAVELFRRVFPRILSRMSEAADPDQAFNAFEGFLRGLPAGVQLFALFDANPQLCDLISDICAVSPELAEYLSRNPIVLDGVIAGEFFSDWPSPKDLLASLGGALHRQADYEGKLNAARIWQKELHFRVGVHLIRDLIGAKTASEQYADLAQTVVAGLVPVVTEEFAKKFGPPPGTGMCVVAMGSLGSGQLTATSDLDLITIYDAQGVEVSEGPKPLATRPYFARLTQALITALSVQMGKAGRLYEVDMRLRPSGQAGPVAVSVSSYEKYQQSEAWVWEHLALTRARVVAGPEALADQINIVRSAVIKDQQDPDRVYKETAEMRDRLATVYVSKGDWHVKTGAGGRQDISLLAQALTLLSGADQARDVIGQLKAGCDGRFISEQQRDPLIAACALYDILTQDEAVIGAAPDDFAALGIGGQRMILRHAGFEKDADLLAEVARLRAKAAKIIDNVLAR